MDRFYIQKSNTELFKQERKRVFQMLREQVSDVEIQEVGSTAIPGVIGKEDLDILVRPELECFEQTRDRLDQILQRNPKQLSNECYQGYNVESPIDVAVQLTIAQGPYDDFLYFMQILKDEPTWIEKYNQLKQNWHGRSMEQYRAAKNAFIESVFQRYESRDTFFCKADLEDTQKCR